MDTATTAAGSSPAIAPTSAAPVIPPTPAAPATPAVTPAPTPATPTARDVALILTPAERRAAATGGKSVAQILAARTPAATPTPAAPAAVEPAAAEPAATPAVAPEPAAADTSVTAEPAAGEPGGEHDTKEPDRFRFKNPEDRAIALLAKTKGISLVAAAKLYAGDAPAATPAAPADAPATPEPAADPDLVRYDTHLGDLDAQLKKLSDERKQAREDVDNEKADSLSDQIADVRTQIGLLKNERQGHVRNREQASTRGFEQQANASRDRLFASYADFAAEGSMPRLALDAFVSKALNDPKRAAMFNDPTWPEKLGEEFAQTHGLKKQGAASATPATPVPATVKPATPTAAALLRPKPAQVPGAKTLSGADGGSPSAANAPSREQLMADLRRMTPEQRKAVIGLIPAAPRR